LAIPSLASVPEAILESMLRLEATEATRSAAIEEFLFLRLEELI
jgi:hypothetical protein